MAFFEVYVGSSRGGWLNSSLDVPYKTLFIHSRGEVRLIVIMVQRCLMVSGRNGIAGQRYRFKSSSFTLN